MNNLFISVIMETWMVVIRCVLSWVFVAQYSDNLLYGVGILLLLFGGAWALAAAWAVRRHGRCIDRDILDQTRVIEVDERSDWDILLLDVIVIQDSLNSLLYLGGWDAFVVFGRALWHI